MLFLNMGEEVSTWITPDIRTQGTSVVRYIGQN
jgi:hypothetical protein